MLLTCAATNVAGLVLVGFELLSYDGEVRFVRGQPQHDEVRVRPAQHVLGVGVVVGGGPLLANVVHDLVLPLPGHIGIRQNHLRTI